MSPPADPPGVPARRAALRLMDAVLRRGAPLEAALPAATRGLERAEDRGLAHAIVAEALRRLPDLDALIDGATRTRIGDDVKARQALRIALVQALALGTPPHAAIATVLPLVEGGPRRLVHGVFGAVMRQGATLPEAPVLPADVAERWRAAWGEEAVASASRLIAAPPPLDLAFPPDAPPPLEGTQLMPGHVRLARGAAVPNIEGYGEGRWWVQDVAASIPARLLGRGGGGRRALDLCAAPGGKTMQLAAAGFDVTALDISQSRLARLSENLARTGLAARTIAADAFEWSPAERFDAILLDAPCSASGIYRRHPEVLHRLRPRAIAQFAEGQRRLLARAADWVAPGGSLVYAVCSLEREEGEAVAAQFLAARADFAVDPVRPGELAEAVPIRDGMVRMLPGVWAADGGADGFFVARFRRAD